jgi:HTH-type transcriptional regulator / antitoxin HigA
MLKRKMNKLIETEAEYEAALTRIDHIFDATPGTPEEKELKLLVLLVRHYEAGKHPVPNPDPIEAIKTRMDDLGLKDKDLIPYLGDKTTVSRILNRRRGLTIAMARRLYQGLGIPAEVLLAETEHA